MPNQVEVSVYFTQLFDLLPTDEKKLISDFVSHYRASGLQGFRGKVGPTDKVPHSDPNRAKKIWFANHNKLWHVHIGHPKWNSCKNPAGGYLTSDYVVHFQRLTATSIALVDYNSHNPMQQPKRESLFKRF